MKEQISSEEEQDLPYRPAISRRVQVKQSPYINTYYSHHPIRVTIDSGAEINMIRTALTKYIGAEITKSSQIALQVDGHSPLTVVGETRITLTRDNKSFLLEALVVDNLEVDVLAGVPFMERNDVTVRPAKHQVILADGMIYQYNAQHKRAGPQVVRRTQAYVLRAPSESKTIWPGEFLEVSIPKDIAHDDLLAVEPRTDIYKKDFILDQWPKPDIITNVGDTVRIPNMSTEPLVLKRHEHFCQIRQTYTPNVEDIPNMSKESPDNRVKPKLIAPLVQVDPDSILSPNMKANFKRLLSQYGCVFDQSYKGYNGAAGKFEAVVNMGPVQPPQRKGRLPLYPRDKMVELQEKFDELEAAGVLKRPEDLNITVEYLNPSFLVKKTSGGFRLVTAFADVGRYSKPQPSLMPDVDSTLRNIARWKYIIVSDLTSAFYQIPLARDSLKYCGIVTPYRGVRVYTRSAMGMPGSETALEELMCRILGDLLRDGIVAKLADDLYCGADSPEQLLQNWERVLQALRKCDMKLSAHKTVIAPKSTTILGWKWSQGHISASPHRIATLSTCSKPNNVRGMRSFIGAYKILSRVIPDCAEMLAPLEDITAGKQSTDKILWSEELYSAFTKAQKALLTNKEIVLPRPNDVLWIVTDGSVKQHGIGATLYVVREQKLKLAGFFSAKLRKRQVRWIPCEVEALSIAAAIKHFSPYIIQSQHKPCILTDSKPCVQAFEKLCRGEFSASPRVSTFLSAVSRFQASLRHIAGTANMISDFASRNAPPCTDQSCQVCTFISDTEETVVRSVNVKDIMAGSVNLPFTNRIAWLNTQYECHDLRRTKAHLQQGTRPSRKITNIKDVKRYLQVATIAKHGLLVVRREDTFAPTRECIILPRAVVEGVLTALHIRLSHPTSHQLKSVIHRYFYALDMDKSIDKVTNRCHQCASLKQVPHTLIQQSTEDPPEAVGVSFAADVLKRERHLILIVRECITSYTIGQIIISEKHDALREALIQACIEMRPLDGPIAIIRTDPAPGFQALQNDERLRAHRICVEVGRIKNPNKNPVAEKAVQEVEQELLRQDPSGGPVSKTSLAVAIARLNSRIRKKGLSARETLLQRDQFTCEQIPLSDHQIIVEQYKSRLSNHPHSERSKAPNGKTALSPRIEVGDLVYVLTDYNKSRARSRYLVVSVDGEWCVIRKFTGSQLRSSSYKVKACECYKVPCEELSSHSQQYSQYRYSSDEDDREAVPEVSPVPPTPPNIPIEIATQEQKDLELSKNKDKTVVDKLFTENGEQKEMEGTQLQQLNEISSNDITEKGHNDINESDKFGQGEQPLRRSSRVRRRPEYMKDFVVPV